MRIVCTGEKHGLETCWWLDKSVVWLIANAYMWNGSARHRKSTRSSEAAMVQDKNLKRLAQGSEVE